VARTIADLDDAASVEVRHIEEAAWYRSPILKHAALAS
jgi:predicted ATPase with chaperone activity